MNARVFNLHSTVEVPTDELDEILDRIVLPDGVEAIEKEIRNESILVLESEPESDDISPYTPTANLKATIEVKTENVEEQPDGSEGLWSSAPTPEEEEEIETEEVEYAGFKGYGEDVLFNTTLQYPMFEVLCQIAIEAETGNISAIAIADGEMIPVKIVDGERRPATVNVVEDEEVENPNAWQNNDFIDAD